MYKHICFRPRLALIFVAAFVIVFGGIISCFQLCLLKCVWNGRYRPPLTRRCCFTVKRMIGRLSYNLFGAGLIVRKSWISCDPISLSYNTRFHCITVAYRRKIFRKIQPFYIVLRSIWIVRVSYEYFFICDYFDSSLRILSNFFSVARIFCRWCVNFERGFSLLNGIKKP